LEAFLAGLEEDCGAALSSEPSVVAIAVGATFRGVLVVEEEVDEDKDEVEEEDEELLILTKLRGFNKLLHFYLFIFRIF
jgi:hypothetical protein